MTLKPLTKENMHKGADRDYNPYRFWTYEKVREAYLLALKKIKEKQDKYNRKHSSMTCAMCLDEEIDILKEAFEGVVEE